MWLFTRYGFFSVVQDHQKRKNVLIRARNRKHLEDLFVSLDFHTPHSAKEVIEETPDRDYRYRVSVDRRAYAGLLQSLAMDLDYPNFKDSVHQRLSKDIPYNQLVNKVWQIVASTLGGCYGSKTIR